MTIDRNLALSKCSRRKKYSFSPQQNLSRRMLFRQGTDYTALLLARTPHNPRQIPTSHLPSKKMNDVVAVLSDPFFFTSDAQPELRKRSLKTSGPKHVLLQRLYAALEVEYAAGWTLGYLLNTKILPFHGTGRDPRSLIGHHIEGYNCDADGAIILRLSDGEDATILSKQPSDSCAKMKMDHDLFWALHTLDGIKAVPLNLSKRPLLIIEAAMGLRRDRWGKEAWTVFGLRLEGMGTIAFFFLAGETCMREDRVCGDVWLSENEILREDTRMLHGGDEMVGGEVGEKWRIKDASMGLKEDMRELHGG